MIGASVAYYDRQGQWLYDAVDHQWSRLPSPPGDPKWDRPLAAIGLEPFAFQAAILGDAGFTAIPDTTTWFRRVEGRG